MRYNHAHWLIRSLLLFILTVCSYAVTAHELRPVIANVEVMAENKIQVELKLNLEAWLVGMGEEHNDTDDSPQSERYQDLRLWRPQQLQQQFQSTKPALVDQLTLRANQSTVELTPNGVTIPAVGDTDFARYSSIIFSGTLPPGTNQLTWQHDQALGDVVVRVRKNNQSEPLFAGSLGAGQTSPPIVLNPTTSAPKHQDFIAYVWVGFEHIVPLGLDHILFIIGLFLLTTKLKPLLWQVTSFTVAHSITLTLGIFGLVQIPASIVEPIIAASILFIVLENIYTDRLRVWRPLVIFVFGLVHGLGFASVLQSFGLPSDQFVSALIGFNVGVELGQLSVLLACFLTVGWFGRKSWYRAAIVLPSSMAVGLIAIYWIVERVEIF